MDSTVRKIVMVPVEGVSFAVVALQHFVDWGLTPMDREMAREALRRLTLISPDGEVISPDKLAQKASEPPFTER